MSCRMLGAAALALLIASPVAAEEIHLSHYGEVMPSIPWAVAFQQDLFRKNAAWARRGCSRHAFETFAHEHLCRES